MIAITKSTVLLIFTGLSTTLGCTAQPSDDTPDTPPAAIETLDQGSDTSNGETKSDEGSGQQ